MGWDVVVLIIVDVLVEVVEVVVVVVEVVVELLVVVEGEGCNRRKYAVTPAIMIMATIITTVTIEIALLCLYMLFISLIRGFPPKLAN